MIQCTDVLQWQKRYRYKYVRPKMSNSVILTEGRIQACLVSHLSTFSSFLLTNIDLWRFKWQLHMQFKTIHMQLEIWGGGGGGGGTTFFISTLPYIETCVKRFFPQTVCDGMWWDVPLASFLRQSDQSYY